MIKHDHTSTISSHLFHQQNNFDLNGLLGFNLHNKTVGVIGLGKIGTAFVKILNGFGANVIYVDPFT